MPSNIDVLFEMAVEKKASDIHLVAGRPPYLRIDGVLQPISKEEPLTGKAVQELVFSVMSREQEERFEKDRELDFAHQTPSGARFRVNTHWEKGNVGLVARLIPLRIPTVADLQLPDVVVGLPNLPHGLVLVTGPAGSGKSTTLATLINIINTSRPANIITLEDPIEFVFKMDKAIIRQRELGSDIRSFGDGLKRVLRQDPNVVMVGEMRDLETISTTLTLAETGHLIFATLHTYNAPETISRIIDVFPPHQQGQIRTQLALSLRAVISQQLLPKVGGGRVAAREVMVMTPAVSNLIRENKVIQLSTVIQTSSKMGMFTLAQDLKRLEKDRLIESEVAEHYLVGPGLATA
ncbi:hypothetical protein A3D72_00205 [Candidatus Uhrbacteria bacterium RIFCSPHIGHO2_02_FULL_57_19]|uniref:AAA+ ATPase domain-containing protein n=1 Tax=Candidatus Uhrbacteria bacterium RIFCSPHIGHO2_02_FULL_57_19 TaxID=1802391 RepID=A0A1F7U6J6_9BACT|nr:MAG: hypothetical protein A3D72_00205 [Candidatus Uhrbacteria bacterium RIFCSPHIGHO2_02_FULL_57_19]